MRDEPRGLFQRADEFAQIFRRGAEFARELVQENERLRRQLIDLERRDTEAENQQLATRYVEVEQENNNLANLYVASYQLHSTLDLSEVLKIIVEIVINLIGAERFAVYMLDERTRLLEAVAAEGLETQALPRFALGEGSVGRAAETRETLCEATEASDDPERPIVCIPLSVQDRTIGAITIYRLLTQKESFTPLDHELFTLLAGHAATAIFAARLHSQSERKLHTIQGFIDLLTK
ncbi:MAG: GAF domain-containing protein [Myxococcota bacterium]